MAESKEDTKGKCVYNEASGYPFQIQIFLNKKKQTLTCSLFLLIDEKVEAIYFFELVEKKDGWFLSWSRIFPPDKSSQQRGEERLSDRKDISQTIFLKKITESCWKIIQELSDEKKIEKKDLSKIFKENFR
jgi:hypothetical protein